MCKTFPLFTEKHIGLCVCSNLEYFSKAYIYIYSSYKYSSDTTERNVNIIINYFNEKFNVMPEQHTCVEIFKW